VLSNLFNNFHFISAWHVRLEQYYLNEPEKAALDKPVLNLKSECGSGSEKENSSNVEGSGPMTSSSGTTTTASSLNVTPIKKKKKRRISDSEEDEDFDDVPAKKEKVKTTVTSNDEMSSVKKSKKSSSDESSKTAKVSEIKAEKRKEERSTEDRERHKKEKDRQHSSTKSCKEKHRERDRDEQMRKEKRREEKRKSSSAPVTPLKTGSSMHRPEQQQPRKNVDELSFKLAQTSSNLTSTSTSNSASVGGVLSNDNSAEAIKKILNGDRVVPAAAVSTASKLPSSAKASPNVTPNKASQAPFRISSSIANGAHAERNKLFPRPLGSEPTSKPSTPKKLVDFSSISSNQNSSSLDLLGSIMSDMNSAMKK
jgi:hypothetical protein